MKPLKHILIFTKEYRHPRISVTGGTGVFYKNLAEKLVEKGYQVTVFGSHKIPVSFVEHNIRYRFVKDYFKLNPIAELFRSITGKHELLKRFHYQFYANENKYLVEKLKSFLKEDHLLPDIIETHDWDGISLFLDELRIPFIVRYHGSWNVLEKHFGYRASQGKIWCEILALSKSKNNIVISEFSKKINEEIFQITSSRLIYNGIDTSFWSPEENGKKIPRSIFFLGEVKEEKGALTALEAFITLKKTVPDATLHYIGKAGSNESKLKEIAGPELAQELIFYGRKKTEEIKQLLCHAEIVFFPSKGENFSLSLLEAMAIGKAVICSRIPSFEEVIDEGINGMQAGSSDEFSEQAVLLFEQPDLRSKLELNARKTVKDRFNIDHMVEETLNYYQELYDKP